MAKFCQKFRQLGPAKIGSGENWVRRKFGPAKIMSTEIALKLKLKLLSPLFLTCENIFSTYLFESEQQHFYLIPH